MELIGMMPMPVDFRYRDVFIKGKPKHGPYDPFRIRHPGMDVRRRAKIFAPFDALKGFNEAIGAKDILYQDMTVLSEEDTAELDRRLRILHSLTYNSRMARANHVQVKVTFFEPCRDRDHEDYGLKGQYKAISGICLNVDTEVTKTILVGSSRISLEDVRKIESPGDLFRNRWDEDPSLSGA